MKKIYRIQNVELHKYGYCRDSLTYTYGGKFFQVDGEFYIDKKGYLHHPHITPTGKEIDVKIKY